MKNWMIGAAAAATLAFATPASAQQWPLVGGDYWEVTGIDVDDGHGLDYANYIANRWMANQEFAKSQGWINSYYAFANVHNREGEPDIYLVTTFNDWPDNAESDRRQAAYEAYMKRTTAQLQAESGERAKFRTIGGTMLLRHLTKR
ncbi:hypothetical protein [Sphingomicrobium nitratireducens]|uniref:hypothetical protein n=1 Tax=Sphingomicrobium nitratireducens TaxID=2964666 RepID=UPI00223EF05D|nr:hypothetical protein [Sphingomicrobium nitratireducens]